MKPQDPSAHCDCRAKSIRNVVIASIAVGLAAALLRSFVFDGQPVAQAVCGLVAALAIVSYGVARLLDAGRYLPWPVYVLVSAAGAALATYWSTRLLM